ncbi:DUF4191 domain-containing protein [Egicoccus sp. AB-alg6-2]|uniref:DUF4191 domain-containing protein n=1 Tax=Egicoccus sp. AB-alg6-2 TaxID=3242692 RepID=UPI00359DE295
MKQRLQQIRMAWGQLKEIDPKAPAMIAAGALAGLLIGALLGLLVNEWVAIPVALLFAFMGAMMVFNRRLQKAQFSAIEGHPGAAAAVLQQMRGQWFVSPAVAVNAKQDLVHRVVGRCGIVLVAEGSSPQRVKALLAKEKKRIGRVAGEVPVHTVLVGDGRGDTVTLNKLQFTMNKFNRELSKTEVPKLERRLKPLDRTAPIPQGIDPNMARRPRPKPR